MNRLQFVRTFLGITAATLVKSPEFLIPRENIEVYSGFIAGYKYYKGPGIESCFHEGDSLELIREPLNSFDDRAIAVYYNGTKIGFIPMVDNHVLAKMLDSKVKLTARIEEFDHEAPTWERVVVWVGMK